MSRLVMSVSYGGHDTSAAIMKNGKVLAASAQERFDRVKHSRNFPLQAILFCLEKANLASINELDIVVFVDDYDLIVRKRYLEPALQRKDGIAALRNRADALKSLLTVEDQFRAETGYEGKIIQKRHHDCHIASAFFPSGFDDALVCSIDGVGEFDTAAFWVGDQKGLVDLNLAWSYPMSLGLMYSAVTDFLGWKHHCDEGIIMGLAPYGDEHAKIPGHADETYSHIFAKMARLDNDGQLKLELDWFAFHREHSVWVSDKFRKYFGPGRQKNEEVSQHHKNIAAALQSLTEQIVLQRLSVLRRDTGRSRLCLAGGVALNCSMNGKILKSGLFDKIFVQPASGDDGTVIGGCFLGYIEIGGSIEDFRESDNQHAYLGYDVSGRNSHNIQLAEEAGVEIIRESSNWESDVAQLLLQGKIVALCQGSAEFGPRALGNRSILALPAPASSRDYINEKVKFREYFRPFAGAILAEDAVDYFDLTQDSPHMLIAVKAKRRAIAEAPAVLHVDNSCRVQTVNSQSNPRLYRLLVEIKELTGTPILLNTSFNVKGQPVVNTASEAISTFLSTAIDALVLEDLIFEKA